MSLEMKSWKVNLDLGHIKRLMEKVEGRLELARGGKHTQEVEQEIVQRLDELIRQLEADSLARREPEDGKLPAD